MGKSWDSFVPPPAIWDECLRVLKPGGHLLAFAGTRTYDLMGISIRMAGFEIRDSIGWVYGSGFPKSLDVSKAIDKAAGAEREVIREKTYELTNTDGVYGESLNTSKPRSESAEITAPSTPEAKQWQGWGTALKPALEPIVVARKPVEGTVANNVLTYGTGGLNIDGSRIGRQEGDVSTGGYGNGGIGMGSVGLDQGEGKDAQWQTSTSGRWPANLILDEYTAELLDEQSGHTVSKSALQVVADIRGGNFIGSSANRDYSTLRGHDDSGGASRFFYVAKASKRDRNEGLEDLGNVMTKRYGEMGQGNTAQQTPRVDAPQKNFHPTVKPTELMRYLVKLITPPGGTVLDPFTGSGSTGKAAILEGFEFIGIELTEDYWPIIEGRLKHAEAKVAERIKETSDQEQEKLF
jgi:site-specific DNA-methyltransferase (adenine-specific)